MHYFCDVCDKAIEIKSKIKHPRSLTHNENEKYIRLIRTIQCPNLFDKDSISNEYINDRNKSSIYTLSKMI